MTKKKNSPNYWVSPTEDGQWRVQREGADRASNIFDKKSDANARARELAIKSQGERITQNRDGSIGSKDSYGDDPPSRKDTEH